MLDLEAELESPGGASSLPSEVNSPAASEAPTRPAVDAFGGTDQEG